ncbi:MAG TPA: FliH/SctL family protein [Gammaproteobacteria bacterium]
MTAQAEAAETIRRWQAPAVESLAPRPAASTEPEGFLTAERLAAIEEQVRTEAYRAGFEQGRLEGFEAGREEAARQAARLASLFESLAPQLKVLDDALLDQLARLVLAVARQFVRRELRSQPGEVVRVVREALAALPASDARVRVYLNPEDAALVRDTLLPETLERPLQLIEDVTLARGGARLETDSSVVDASTETRLGLIAARLLGDERASMALGDSVEP